MCARDDIEEYRIFALFIVSNSFVSPPPRLRLFSRILHQTVCYETESIKRGNVKDFVTREKRDERIIKCKAKLFETSELLSNEFCINYTHIHEVHTHRDGPSEENLRSDFNVIRICFHTARERDVWLFLVSALREKAPRRNMWIKYFLLNCHDHWVSSCVLYGIVKYVAKKIKIENS